MNASPLHFDTPAGPCSGWFHAPAAPARDVAVLMCSPLGYEALCTYTAWRQLAEAFALAGFAVLRFDYHGTGDSAGGDPDPGRVQAWLQSIDSAARTLRTLAGTDRLAMFGMRLGGTLAVQAALGGTAAETLMLWAPCPTGKSFAREVRAAHASRGGAADADVEALGTLFTSQTLLDLRTLDATAAPRAPARKILVIGRDDLPGEGPLPAAFRALGAEVTATEWPGYAGMMAEPHDARLDRDTLHAIMGWLCAAHPQRRAALHPQTVPAARGLVTDGAFETPVIFGAGGLLAGILAEPAGTEGKTERGQTAVLLLNVGGNYHVGPNRVYVKAARQLAAAGYCVLRMDVAGVGDSSTGASEAASAGMYRQHAVADVQAAIDMLSSRGCKRFWVMGICSGSYLAFETALHDERVTGQVLLNSRLLEWDAERSGPWQSSMQEYYKSTRYYRQALLRGDVYARLLRGQVNVRGIASRLWSLAAARLRRVADRMLHRAPQEGVLRKFRHLCARGVDTLVVMSEQDDGLDYVEFHIGQGGSRMRGQPNFRMALVPDADHTFSTVRSQQAMLSLVRSHLDARHAPSPSGGAVAARVATT